MRLAKRLGRADPVRPRLGQHQHLGLLAVAGRAAQPAVESRHREILAHPQHQLGRIEWRPVMAAMADSIEPEPALDGLVEAQRIGR